MHQKWSHGDFWSTLTTSNCYLSWKFGWKASKLFFRSFTWGFYITLGVSKRKVTLSWMQRHPYMRLLLPKPLCMGRMCSCHFTLRIWPLDTKKTIQQNCFPYPIPDLDFLLLLQYVFSPLYHSLSRKNIGSLSPGFDGHEEHQAEAFDELPTYHRGTSENRTRTSDQVDESRTTQTRINHSSTMEGETQQINKVHMSKRLISPFCINIQNPEDSNYK